MCVILIAVSYESGFNDPLSIADKDFLCLFNTETEEIMAQKQKSVAEVVWGLAEPLAQEFGYFLWDVEFVREGSKRILRITIDSEEGIGVDDCEKLHRAIDPILDEADPIEEAYYLEVSSPGIERELKNDMHIEYCMGADVEVRLYAPREGSKVFRGELVELREDGGISIKSGDIKIDFDKASIAKIKTVFEF